MANRSSAEIGDPPQAPRCPSCGSEQVTPVRKDYDGGLGCLGLLLFGWWGLLLGLLGGNDIEMYCIKCGYRWSPGGKGCLSGCAGLFFGLVITAFLFLLLLVVLGLLAV